MLKKFFISLLFICCSVSAFADSYQDKLKLKYYNDGKLIDTMYVKRDSLYTGYHIKSEPSSNAKTLCELPTGTPLKVVAVGKYERLSVAGESCQDFWVEVLIPRYLWKSSEPEYGWTYGGELSITEPEFSVPENDEELFRYLTRFCYLQQFDEEPKEIRYDTDHQFYNQIAFLKNNKYVESYDKSSSVGVYMPLSKNAVSLMRVSYEWEGDYESDYGEDYEPPLPSVNCHIVKFYNITETGFEAEFNEINYGNKYHCYYVFCSSVENRINLTVPGLYCKDHTGLNKYILLEKIYRRNFILLEYGDEEYGKNIIQSVTLEEAVKELIKSGVDAKGTKYQQMYRDYWDPIIQKHQKAADGNLN